MFKRASLLCLLLSFLSTTTQAWPQQESPPNSLRILVEGEPLLSRSIIEAARRINAKYDVKFEFVDGQDARHDLRLIVSGGNGKVQFSGMCSDNVISPAQYYYNSIVALTPNGKLLFTVSRSGGSPREIVEDATTEAIRNIYSQSTLLQKQSPFNSGAPQETVKPIEPAVQEPPAEPGVYYKSSVGWIRLSPPSGRVEGTRTGFSGVRRTKVYAGAHAKAQVAELKPEFYVRGFPVSEQEIRIVRLETKQDHREAQIDSGNLRHTNSVYKASDINTVTVTRVSNRIHKITPAFDLRSGEYSLILYISYSKDGKHSEYSEDGEYEFGITLSKK
ncbi:MAG: hypothetical protein ACREA2_22530 [Blastocatellia bacterium]